MKPSLFFQSDQNPHREDAGSGWLSVTVGTQYHPEQQDTLQALPSGFRKNKNEVLYGWTVHSSEVAAEAWLGQERGIRPTRAKGWRDGPSLSTPSLTEPDHWNRAAGVGPKLCFFNAQIMECSLPPPNSACVNNLNHLTKCQYHVQGEHYVIIT